MKRVFDIDYAGVGNIIIIVDLDKFTEDDAKMCLEFFRWDDFVDYEGDLMFEYMKKLSIVCFQNGMGKSLYGLIEEMKGMEGYPPLDGTVGIEIVTFYAYEFEEEELNFTETEIE